MRDTAWMDETYPLHAELIDQAIDELVATRAQERQTQAGLVERNLICTRVTGPIGGYYIAVYACPVGELGRAFVGSFKICCARPASYWDAAFILSGSCNECEPTAFDAMQGAEALAVLKIAFL